jgi:hypothetical protein
MTTESIQGVLDLRERESRVCAECGAENKALVMPERLPYLEAKRYQGPMYCLSHAPRFKSLPTLDLGGDAA